MRKLFFVFSIVISSVFYAQNITFEYELKFKPNPDKNSFEIDVYYLDVLGQQSVFRSQKDRRSDSLTERTGYGLGIMPIFDNQLYVQKNLVKKLITKNIIRSSFNDKYSITINESLDWKLSADKMTINEIDCQKAEVSYGGRNWTAWFAQSIPLQEGPYVFNGLPGLIVKISDDKDEYDFTLVRIKNSNKNNMFALRNGKEISWQDFQKIRMDYYQDPFAEVKARNIKVQAGDANGNPVEMNFKQLTETIQKQIRENNNPIELNHKVDYK
ncbi:MAG: GLPGLI family protein [Bergeyella sp.]